MSLNWVTPAGFLLTATEATTVTSAVVATGTDVEYRLLSGTLPGGLTLSTDGVISGVVESVISPTTSTFVVRAKNPLGVTKDRTFEIFVPCENPPVWQGPYGFVQQGTTLQGFILNQEWVDIQFVAGPPLVHSDDYPITYSIDKSFKRLPKGLVFTNDGHLKGTMNVDVLPGEYYPFEFRVVATDGYASSTQTVVVNIIDSDTFRVDTTVLRMTTGTATISLLDLSLPGSASFSFIQPPEFINGDDLGIIYSDDKHYIPVTAYDPMPLVGPVVYSVVNGGSEHLNPPAGLQIEPNTGYLYGYISTQTAYLKNYSITVKATKFDKKTGSSLTATNTFTLGVLSDEQTKITWDTDGNLGSIEEGIISELSVSATSESIYDLQYRLLPGEAMPPGLTLSTSGNIIGAATTSGVFTATVLASTGTYTDLMLNGISYPYEFSTQTFTLNVTPVSAEYTSMYVKPFLKLSQREKYNNFINSASIFIPEVLYRAEDPNFGVQTELKMTLEFGIEKLNLGDYSAALTNNFYKRRLNFGDVKIAIAKDNSGKHIYDVVYVSIVDDIEGAKSAITINNQVYYPGSIDNMRNSLSSIELDDFSTIDINEHKLPRFMQTTQAGDIRPTEYIKAVILCYTLPGQGSKITSRIRASKFDFKLLDFEIDRIVVQNSLDYDTAKYLIFPRTSITDTGI